MKHAFGFGAETYREWFDRECTPVHAAAAAHGHVAVSVKHIMSAVESVSYDRASEAYKNRWLKNVTVVDILIQPFKSFAEQLRSLLRQVTEPTVYSVLTGSKAGEEGYIMSVGDYPKIAMQDKLVSQGNTSNS